MPSVASSSTAGADPTRVDDPTRRSPAASPVASPGREATVLKSPEANNLPPSPSFITPSSTSTVHPGPASTDTPSGSGEPDQPLSVAQGRPGQHARPSLKAQARNSFNAAFRSGKSKSGRSSSSKMVVEPERAGDVLQGREEGGEGPPPSAPPSVNVPLRTSPRASTTSARQYSRAPAAPSSRSGALASHFAPKHRKTPSGSKGKSFFLKTGETEVPIPHRLANSLVLKSPESPFFARTFGSVDDPRQRFQRMATHPPAARVSPQGRASPKRYNSDQTTRSSSSGSALPEAPVNTATPASSSSSLAESVEPLSSATSSADSLSTPSSSFVPPPHLPRDDSTPTQVKPSSNGDRRGSDQSGGSTSSGNSSSSSNPTFASSSSSSSRKLPSGEDDLARRSSSDVGSSGEDRTKKRRMQWADLMLGFRGVRLGDASASGERRRTVTAGSGGTVGEGSEDRSDRATHGGLEDEYY